MPRTLPRQHSVTEIRRRPVIRPQESRLRLLLWHGERQQVARDRQRLNRLTAAGWRVLFVTADDLRSPTRLLARLRAALATPSRSV